MSQAPLLDKDGTPQWHPGKKANILIDFYAKVTTTPAFEKARRPVRRRNAIRIRKESEVDKNNVLICEDHVRDALRRAKNGKAPGVDGMDAEQYKIPSESLAKPLTEFFNQLIEKNEIPVIWPQSIICPFLKVGKPADEPSSYRPVSLLPALRKIYERTLIHCLMPFVLPKVHPSQYAYVPGRSGEEMLLELADTIHNCMQEGTSTVGLVLFDASRAFDSVDHTDIEESLLNEFSIPAKLVRATMRLVRGRTGRVAVWHEGLRYLSRPRNFHKGVPQGSVLGPFLYMALTNSLYSSAPSNITLKGYADDVKARAEDSNPVRLESRLQEGVAHVEQWSASKGINLCKEKCKHALYGIHQGLTLNLEVGGEKVDRCDNPRILGVNFDSSLSFETTCEEKIDQLRRRTRVLYCLRGSKWGVSEKMLHLMYNNYVIGRLAYGLGIFYPYLSKERKRRLQVAANIGPRIIMSLPVTTRLAVLRKASHTNTVERLAAKIALSQRARQSISIHTQDRSQFEEWDMGSSESGWPKTQLLSLLGMRKVPV